MAKGYLIALVKMTNPDNFMTNYGSVVADVFAKFDGRFLVRTPDVTHHCLLYTSPSPRDLSTSRMPSSA